MSYSWILVHYFIILAIHLDKVQGDLAVYIDYHDVEIFLDNEWPFSQPLPLSGMEGVIVDANPGNACSNISGPPDVNQTLNWFVLVAGDSCDYHTKVLCSQLAGYSAVVIYSAEKRNISYKRHSTHIFPYPNISAVVIRKQSGLIIKEKYLYTVDKRFRLYIYPNSSFDLMTFLLIFAIAAAAFILTMLFCMIIRCVQGTRQILNSRLSSRHLKKLQTRRYKRGDPYDTCAICLEDYKERDRLRILPCSHGYHAKCIDPWLTNNRRTCPVCKQKVILFNDCSQSDADSDAESRTEVSPLLRNLGETHGTFNTRYLQSNLHPHSSLVFHGDAGRNNVQNAIANAFVDILDDENLSHTRSAVDSAVQVDLPITNLDAPGSSFVPQMSDNVDESCNVNLVISGKPLKTISNVKL